MSITNHPAATCQTGTPAAILALGLASPDAQHTVYIHKFHEGPMVHLDALCCDSDAPSGKYKTKTRALSSFVGTNEVYCADCAEGDWLPEPTDTFAEADAVAVDLLRQWSGVALKRGLRPLWNPEQDGVSTVAVNALWEDGIGLLLDSVEYDGPATRVVRDVVVHDLSTVEALPAVQAVMRRSRLLDWATTAASNSSPLDIPDGTLFDGIPDTVRTEHSAILAAATDGTDHEVEAWYDRVRGPWVWTSHAIAPGVLQRMAAVPDPNQLNSGLFKVPAAAVFDATRQVTYTRRPDRLARHVSAGEPDELVHEAARVAGRFNADKISGLTAALAAARI